MLWYWQTKKMSKNRQKLSEKCDKELKFGNTEEGSKSPPGGGLSADFPRNGMWEEKLQNKAIIQQLPHSFHIVNGTACGADGKMHWKE